MGQLRGSLGAKIVTANFGEFRTGEVRRTPLLPTVTLSVIALRSVGWNTVRVPNVDHFRAILGSQKGVSRLLNGAFGLSAAVGLRRFLA